MAINNYAPSQKSEINPFYIKQIIQEIISWINQLINNSAAKFIYNEINRHGIISGYFYERDHCYSHLSNFVIDKFSSDEHNAKYLSPLEAQT